jgi:formylglycine-generating enzyme required for sulfatase activity
VDTLDAAPVIDNRQRVLRGGAFITYQSAVRSAARITSTPTYRDFTLGFRVARTCD